MTRHEKALLETDNRDANGDIETMYPNGIWATCCPLFVCCGNEECEIETIATDKKDNVIGCRGITCAQCWAKEYP